MATVTFNFSTAQSNRIDEARTAYNAINGTSLTPKQYLLTIIRETVQAQVLAKIGNDAEAAAQTNLNNDLVGNA
jgi:hypothetical protein